MARFSACRSTFSIRRRMRHRAYVPDVRENAARVVLEQNCQFAVSAPGASDRLLEDLSFGRAKTIAGRRNVGQGAVEANVTLALLLRVVKRMSVKEGPYELAAYVFETEFEMRVLIDSVMAGVKSGRTYGGALLFGDLLRRNQARGIAGPSGGNRGVIRMRERIPQRNAAEPPARQLRAPELRQSCMVNERPCSANSTPRLHGANSKVTSCLWRLGRLDGLRGLLVLPLEALHASGCVEQLLFPGEEWMAARANLDSHEIRFVGGTRLEGAPAGAVHRNFVIIRMDSGFHFYSFRSRSARLLGKLQSRR